MKMETNKEILEAIKLDLRLLKRALNNKPCVLITDIEYKIDILLEQKE